MNQSLICSFLKNLWRRWPITIVTTTIAVPIASWAYVHLSIPPGPTLRAYISQQNIPATRTGSLHEAHPSHIRQGKTQRALPAFRRVEVGSEEVDYVAEDVTVRLFAPPPKAKTTRSGTNQVNRGEEVTTHYFADNRAAKSEQ